MYVGTIRTVANDCAYDIYASHEVVIDTLYEFLLLVVVPTAAATRLTRSKQIRKSNAMGR